MRHEIDFFNVNVKKKQELLAFAAHVLPPRTCSAIVHLYKTFKWPWFSIRSSVDSLQKINILSS